MVMLAGVGYVGTIPESRMHVRRVNDTVEQSGDSALNKLQFADWMFDVSRLFLRVFARPVKALVGGWLCVRECFHFSLRNR